MQKKVFFMKLTIGVAFTTLHFFITYKWPNKLECYIKLGWKGLPVINALAYWAHLYVVKKMLLPEPELL